MTQLNLEALRVAAEHAARYLDSNGAMSTEPWVAFVQLANPSTILQLIARLEASERDGERYRELRANRSVLLVTGFFGNGCVNRSIEEVDAAIDAQIAARKE